jgi:membrane-bound serine protease (ClpP class)
MKRTIISLFGIALLLLVPGTETCAETESEATSFIIPVKGPIERGLLYAVRRGLSQAESGGANAVIFHMDTPGGRVNVTEEIIRMLIDLPADIETYTLVDKDALSAGALIAMSTEHIYMTPGSRIGASAIVSAFGDIPEGDLKEKHVSSTLALARSAAERNNHDPRLVVAMMRRDAQYRIGDRVICPKGKLLTLSATEASETVDRDGTEQPLLASGIVTNMPQLLEMTGRSESKIVRIEQSWAEWLARRIEMFSALFLIGGLLGIYVEIKTPGFGIPGLFGALCLAVFFWGHNVAGLAGFEEVLLFFLGVLLLALEVFVIPGFGIAGISGIALMTASLLFAMVENYPGTAWFDIPAGQIQGAVVSVGAALISSVILMMLLARYLPRTHMFSPVFLESSMSRDDGYSASEETPELMGAEGTAATQLRPAGIGQFDGKRLNVVARGAFIEKDQPIVIAEIHGNRIVVDKIRS